MPMLNRSTSDRWQSAKKRLVPIIPMLRISLNNLAAAVRQPRSLCRRRAAVQTFVGDQGKGAWSRSSRCRVSLNNLAELYRTQGRYSDALPIVQRTISQNTASKSIAFAVLYGSQFAKSHFAERRHWTRATPSFSVRYHPPQAKPYQILRLALRRALTNSHSLSAKIRI